MKEAKNPLRIFFNVAICALLVDLLNISLKAYKIIKPSDMVSFTWNSIQKFVVITGLLIFIYYYIRKSMVAWYVWMAICFISLPLLFLIDLPVPEDSKISSMQILIILLICWVLASLSVAVRYKSYKNYTSSTSGYEDI